MKKLREPVYDEAMMERYIGIVKERLGINDDELDGLMKMLPHQHHEYRTDKLDPIIRRIVS